MLVLEHWVRDGSQRFWNELGIGRRILAIGAAKKIFTNLKAWKEVSDALLSTGVSIAEEFLKRLQREYGQRH